MKKDMIGPCVYGRGVGEIVRPVRGYTQRTHRDLLVDLCREHDMRIANTWYRHKDANRDTHALPRAERRPEGPYWDPLRYGQIDFCLDPNRWRGMILDVRSSTDDAPPSDHFPVEVRVRLRLAAHGR